MFHSPPLPEQPWHIFLLAKLIFILCIYPACKSPAQSEVPEQGRSYSSYITGDAEDAVTAVRPGLVLMGGGPDVDAAFQWMIDRSGGGDFVVIRTSGTDAYNPYIDGLGSVNSIETILFYSRNAAFDNVVLDKLRQAEALFIAGGDQNTYVRMWKDTPMENIINNQLAGKIPIGGTSAGLAVLGEFFFQARLGTVYSEEVLTNPYHSAVTLDKDFLQLPYLQNTITDSHFSNRSRMGRLIGFLARITQDGWAEQPRAVGIDETTALVVDEGGNARVLGNRSVFFLKSPGKPEICRENTPLTYKNIHVYQLFSTGTFHLPSWTGSGGTAYFLSVEDGKLKLTTFANLDYSRAEIAADDDNTFIYCRPEEHSDEGS
jgi:cyanophycinase